MWVVAEETGLWTDSLVPGGGPVCINRGTASVRGASLRGTSCESVRCEPASQGARCESQTLPHTL